jgi:hypothetical protein
MRVGRTSGLLITNSLLHRFLLRRRGRRDGRLGVPQADEERPSEQERQLLARAVQHMERLVAGYAAQIRRWEAALGAAMERFRTLLTAFEDEARRFNERRHQLGRNVVLTHVNKGTYKILLALIAVGEFVLNAQAFEVFHKPMLLTWLMALTVAVIIPWMAHACGIWIRQWPKPWWATAVKLASSIGMTMGCLVGINRARQFYLETEQLSAGTQSGILEHAFLAINIFVFLGAMVLSHFAHDPDYELEKLHERVSKVDRKLDQADRQIYHAQGKLEGLYETQRAEIEEIRAIIGELVLIYREANRLARPTERVKAFQQDPQVPTVDQSQAPGKLAEWKQAVEELRRKRYEARRGERVATTA